MTRIALISDIHGNLVALRAVLADVAASGIDQTVCLGDAGATGPEPRGVLDWLRQAAVPTVMGNTDAWLLDPRPAKPPEQASDDDRRLYELELWSAAQLDESDRALIRAFAPTLSLDLGDGTLLAYHGSPRNFNDIIRPDTAEAQLDEWLGGYAATVYAGGHTHVAMLRPYRDALVVNPGSVGLPYRAAPGGGLVNPAWAEYAIVEWSRGRQVVEFRRVAYALDDLRAAVARSGMPHGDWYLQDWRD